MAQPLEQRELELVGKVELRIALVESDAKLESILQTYLPPLLLKLASPHLNVRNKVISVCQHVNTRIKSPLIKLPVTALLQQYKANRNPLTRHFDLLYIQQGVDRLATTDRPELISPLLVGLASNYQDSKNHVASLFHVLLKLLHSLVLPPRGNEADASLRKRLGFDDHIEDAEFVASWLGKLLLLGSVSRSNESRRKIILYVDIADFTIGKAKSSNGLTAADCDFLQLYGRNEIWQQDAGGLNLIETKVRAANFLASGAFVDKERYFPALFASADPNSRLSGIGDDILKRASLAVSLEDPRLISALLHLYLGTRRPEGALPASAPLRIKILTLLCKSKTASSFTEENLQIIREGLSPQEATKANGTDDRPVRQGLEAGKLRGQVFAYANWCARIGAPADIEAIGPTLVNRIRNYIESQDIETHISPNELSLRRYGYESIGLLAAASSSELLLEANLDLLRWFFNSLSSDPTGKETSISIEQGLSSVLGAFATSLNPELQSSVTNLLSYHMTLVIGEDQVSGHAVVRSTRYVAVKFANSCLPYSNTVARWINVLAQTGGTADGHEVIEEGIKGLDPYWHRNQKSHPREPETTPAGYEFPDFAELVTLFSVNDTFSTNISFKARDTAALFCFSVLMHQALASEHVAPTIDTEWDRKLEALIASDNDARLVVRRYLKRPTEGKDALDHALKQLLDVLLDILVQSTENHGSRRPECLLRLISLAPEEILPSTVMSCKAILSNDKATRFAASNIFGVLNSRPHICYSSVQGNLDILMSKATSWEQAIGSEILQTHGAILAVAFWISRMSHRDRYTSDVVDCLRQFFPTILGILLRSRDSLLLEAATVSFAEFNAFGVIDILQLPAPFTTATVLQKLKQRSQSEDERAITALGFVGMCCVEDLSEDSILKIIVNSLHDLHSIRHAEVQFAVGAALSCVAIGWRSDYMAGKLDIDGPPPNLPERKKTLRLVVDMVLASSNTSKPALRQASVIWLLCLVQYCGQYQEIHSCLRKLQAAFKNHLSDYDSLSRETAARGLALVYEKGDRSVKDDLIRELVASFTGNNAGLSGNVSEETELFEPGALPIGDNQSITTYQDIMSLAAEVGDPSLVYRFMSMASNNAIWSSRAAFGHFGLSRILSDSSVDGFLAQNTKLYPALFRYRHDPNSSVRAVMNDIWKALVKEPAMIVEKHFNSILEDLLKNIVGREWRARQASCAAIADLVQGKPLEKYEQYLHEIWSLTYKVCDDIKGSVREAAQALARILAGILTRSLEVGNNSTKNVDSMLKVVIPFLFSPSGLESASEEIQIFSLSTLLDIIKSANSKTLRPYIPTITGQLVGLLSSFEHEGVNYLHLNADKYGVTTQQIDDARLMGVKDSPIMEAIERCLDMLDPASMMELQEKLENAIKTAVGLPSKVGSSRVLVTLSTRQNFIFKPHANHFLQLTRKQLLDRNDTVSSAYASACGYLSRLATDFEILNLVRYCQKLYFDSDNERSRSIASETIYALSKHATDRFNALAGAILPFVFVAKHDPIEQTKTIFKNTWDENVGGSRAVMLYLKDIVDLATQRLESPRWAVKHTSAFAIGTATDSIGSNISEAQVRILWPALEKAISGKTWAGKEKVLQALVTLAKNSKILEADGDAKLGDAMQIIMFRESRRNNPPYRQEALAKLAEFVQLRADKDLFTQVLEVTEPMMREALDDAVDVDMDSLSEAHSSHAVMELIISHALSALLTSINPQCKTTSDLIKALTRTFDLIKSAARRNVSRIIQDTIYDAEKSLFDRMKNVAMSEDLESILLQYATDLSGSNSQVELSRMKAADVAVALGPLARKGTRLRANLCDQLARLLAHERSVPVQKRLQSGIEAVRRVDD